MKSFFSEKRGQKLVCVLYTGAHYTRVNTVREIQSGFRNPEGLPKRPGVPANQNIKSCK